MTQSLAAKTSTSLFCIGLLSYSASRIAYCSNIRNIFVDSALRYAPLLTTLAICRSIKLSIKALRNHNVVNKKETSLRLLINSLFLGWIGSVALVPAGEQLFSGLSAHLDSACQIGKGCFIAWDTYQERTDQPTLPGKLGDNVFGRGSIPAYFLLIVPTLINTPLLSESFCPRIGSGLAIANLCYQLYQERS